MASTISAPLEAESLATATVLTGLEREQTFGGIATENRRAALQDTSQIISEVKSKFKSRLAFVRQKHPDKPLAEFTQQLFGLSGSAPPPHNILQAAASWVSSASHNRMVKKD